MSCLSHSAVILLVILLAASTLARTAPEIDGTLPFLDDANQTKTYVVKDFPTGYEPASTDEDWEPFFRDNLLPDLRPYLTQIERTGKKLPTRRLATQIRRLLRTDWLWNRCGVAIIRNNKIYALTSSHGDKLMKRRIHRNLAVLGDLSAQLNLTLPDTVFIQNAYDEPACRLAGGCVAPIFSMLKRADRVMNKTIDWDMLFPHMGHAFYRLIFYPWKDKNPRGLLRATMQNTMTEQATRVKLAALSASPEGAPYLDVGFVSNKKRGYKMPEAFKKNYAGIIKHTQYKFLINANGHTASSRRGHIMQCNSVTLEEDSRWMEYYWRSLKPYVHYLPYTAETVLPLLKKYSDPGRDGELRAIANASQHFVAKYLTLEGKVRYAIRALHEYNKLFDGLPEFVRGFQGLKPELAPVVWQQLKARDVTGNASDLHKTRPYLSDRYLAGSFDVADLVESLKAFRPVDLLHA